MQVSFSASMGVSFSASPGIGFPSIITVGREINFALPDLAASAEQGSQVTV